MFPGLGQKTQGWNEHGRPPPPSRAEIKILLQRASHDSLKCPLARLMGNSLSWGALERCLRRGAAHWWPLCTTKTCSQNTLGPGNGPFCPLVLSTDTALHPNIIIIWLRRNVLTSPASNEDGPGAKTQQADSSTPHQVKSNPMPILQGHPCSCMWIETTTGNVNNKNQTDWSYQSCPQSQVKMKATNNPTTFCSLAYSPDDYLTPSPQSTWLSLLMISVAISQRK